MRTPDANAYADGHQSYGFLGEPACRFRYDKGMGAWTKPDGRTATASEVAREVTSEFWLCDVDDGALPDPLTFGTHHTRYASNIPHIETIGQYTETYTYNTSTGRLDRGEFHHYVEPWCDRLMIAQNAHVQETQDAHGDTQYNLVIPSPRWFAPKKLTNATDSGIPDAQLERRPFRSPESSRADVEGRFEWYYDGEIRWRRIPSAWDQPYYADWSGLPKIARRTPFEHKKEGKVYDFYPPTATAARDAAIHEMLTDTNDFGRWDPISTSEMYQDLEEGDGEDYDTRLLYSLGHKEIVDEQTGDVSHEYWPIYWGAGGAPEVYTVSRLEYAMQGNCVWDSSDMPKFVQSDGGIDMLYSIDPGKQGRAFDLCVMFRTYHYKTVRFQKVGRVTTKTTVARGYFNTKCYARARVIAPAPPA